ncbi:P-II family nitrogen regulator [Agathobacter sp.]
MKKVEIVVKPEKVGIVQLVLTECNVGGVMTSKISGHGNQHGENFNFHGIMGTESNLSKVKIETVIPDEKEECLIKELLEALPTGEIGDGKIFTYDVEDAIRIRTGEKGNQAL